MGIGLLAAGLSSALTAALAAAYVYKGISNNTDERSLSFKLVWILILTIGTLVSLTKINMILIIKFAQIANALILPLLAVFLWKVSNSKTIMGEHRNTRVSNICALLVIVITFALSFKTLMLFF